MHGSGDERLHRFHADGVAIGDSAAVGEGWVVSTSGDYVPVEDRLVPAWVELELTGDEDSPTVVGRVEVRGGIPEVVEVRLVSRPGEREIRQTDLRTVEVRALVELAAGLAVQVTDDNDRGGVVRWDPSDPDYYKSSIEALMRARAASRARRVTPQLLERVAEVYRANIDDRPVKAVQKRFLVGDRMAAEYVLRARRAGYLPPTSPGKKKA